MRYGLFQFVTDETIAPVPLGRAAEDAGFESLFLPEHSHIPASRDTPYPGGGALPRKYLRTYDPFVALATIAATTERLRVGTGICLVIERDPIITAKEVASLDRLSGGRFLFGVGAGWNREEMHDHGTDPATRMALLVERVAAMRAIWASDEAAYDGELVTFPPLWSWPKPVQERAGVPAPPILVGGNGPGVLDRVLAVGDEWFPNRTPEDVLAGRIADLNRRAADAGRGPFGVSVLGVQKDKGTIERLAAMGVTRCVFTLSDGGEAETLDAVGRLGDLVRSLG